MSHVPFTYLTSRSAPCAVRSRGTRNKLEARCPDSHRPVPREVQGTETLSLLLHDSHYLQNARIGAPGDLSIITDV